MISLPALVVLLVAGFFLIRALPAVIWKVALGIFGLLAACELIVALALLVALIPGCDQDCLPDIPVQVETLWADERSPSNSPAQISGDDASAIDPIDLSDDHRSPAQYAAQRDEIERQWHAAELERRLWHAGSLAGGVFIWLAIATAYLKLDLHSSGRHRGRLRLAAATALALATAAATWAWTQPL
ncbi:MAG TPA: hypothetical protein VIK18_25940 [Pirellulales bacterium]